MTEYNGEKFGRVVFVCSKPLQFFNCASIARSLSLESSTIFIVTKSIAQWQDFKEYVLGSKYTSVFGDIKFYIDHKSVAAFLKKNCDYDSLFIECDRLANYNIFSSLKRQNLSVFEEGFGTYSGGPCGKFKLLRWLKWKLFSITTGSGMYFGDGVKTDFIFVCNVDLYKKLNVKSAKKAVPFPGIMDELEYNDDFFSEMEVKDLLPGDGGRVALILGTWGGAKDIEKELVQGYSSIIYKAHPHDNCWLNVGDVKVIEKSWAPAEMLIFKLAAEVRELTVYHYSSSATFYCSSLKNVTFIDLLNNQRFLEVVGEGREQ